MPPWRPTTRPRRRPRRKSRLRVPTWRKNWPPCASGGRRRRPIWQSLRRAAMARSHAPTRTPGCWPSTGKIVSGYNVQIAVDDKHKLIPAFARTASAVVNDGNDTGQLYALAEAAKEALGVAALTAVADTGYYNGATLKACEDAAITAYVPPPDRGQRLKAQGRFSVADFRYDAGADVYRCPAGAALRPMPGQKRQAS